MSFLRFASPTSLAGALLLSMLPWVEVRCDNHRERRVETRQISGLQLAFGGETIAVNGQVVDATYGKHRSQFEDANRSYARNLMTGYVCVLLVGIVAGFAMSASLKRALTVGTAGFLAIVLLVWVALECFPMVGRPPERTRETMLDFTTQSRFTAWYWLSYVANSVCLLSCVGEYLLSPPYTATP